MATDLVILGRIHPDKGTADAIRIGRRTGRRLLICGIVQDHEYFDTEGPATHRRRHGRLSGVGRPAAASGQCSGSAHALLHPIAFDEPFGLSVVEAMACGTPVIAYRRGSMPEIIDHGRTGYLVDSLDEAVAAVDRVADLDRSQLPCDSAARRFSADRMVRDYVAVYEQILRSGR